MLIHAPVRTQTGDEVKVSARIEFKDKIQTLWFKFRNLDRLRITRDIDPFVVALLLLAMKRREPIRARGTLSKKLFQGLFEYQKVFHAWFPQDFHLVEIEVEGLREDQAQNRHLHPPTVPRQACAFSGGVDSFFTFLTLLRQDPTAKPHSPTFRQAIFMAGFDMPINLTQSIQSLTDSYSKMMEEMQIQLVVGSTNIRNFVNTVDWTNAHGQALAATALFFKEEWDEFFIPASYTGATYPQWGTHPRLDPLLSTESLTLIHHGASANRVQKLKLITQFPISYPQLRVCWIQDIGLKNCGNCEKCIRTMIALAILEKLPHYSTFNDQKLSRSKIRNLTQRTHQARLFAREMMCEALRRGKYRIFLDLGYSLIKRQLRHSLNPRSS